MGGPHRRYGNRLWPPALSQPDSGARQGEAICRSTCGLSVSQRRLGQCDRNLQADPHHQRDEPGDAFDGRRQRGRQCRCLCPDQGRHPDRADLWLDRQQRDEVGAAPEHRAHCPVLRAVSGALPAIPDAEDRPSRVEGLHHRIFLSRGMGTALCDPAHDADVQGSGRHDGGCWRQGPEPGELHRDGRRQQRYRHSGRLSDCLGAVPCGRRRQGCDGHFKQRDKLPQSQSERGGGSGPRGQHWQCRTREHEL